MHLVCVVLLEKRDYNKMATPRDVNFSELLGIRNQHIKKNNKNNNILIFCSSFAMHPSNCVSVLTLRKKVTSKKKKKSHVFLDAWDFTCLAGCFAFMREILHAWCESMRNSVQAWDTCPLRESWQPWPPHLLIEWLLWGLLSFKIQNMLEV